MRQADNDRETALRRDFDRIFHIASPADDLDFDPERWWERYRTRIRPRSYAFLAAAAAAAGVLVLAAAVLHERSGPPPAAAVTRISRSAAERRALSFVRRQDPKASSLLVVRANLLGRTSFETVLPNASPFSPPYWDIQLRGPVVVSGQWSELVAVVVSPKMGKVRAVYPEAHVYPVQHLPVNLWPFVPEQITNLALTSGGPAEAWARPRSRPQALHVLAKLLQGAIVVHPHLAAASRRKVVIMDPIGPPVLYLQIDGGQVLQIFPANTVHVSAGGQMSVSYVPGVVALKVGREEMFLQDKALTAWIMNWQWRPLFTLQGTYWFP